MRKQEVIMLSKVSYAFQCDVELIEEKDGAFLVPFSSSFPDDWAFEEYDVDQGTVDGVFCWIVKPKHTGGVQK